MIGQDRANVHRFGISQPGDERDPWFGSGERRAALESWVRDGAMSPATQAAVMEGGVRVFVELLGQGNQASGVRVRLDSAPAGGGDPDGLGGSSGGDLGRGDLGRGDLGRGDLGRGDLVISPE